jgi:Ca2+-binding RTX toxin-like protein
MARRPIYGTPGNNVLGGGSSDDDIYGYAGHDVLYGFAGDDRLYGDAGQDRLFGGVGSDTVYGGANRDIVLGDAGNDLVFGDDGDDLVIGGDGRDMVTGGRGNDLLIGGRESPTKKNTVLLDNAADTFVFDFSTAIGNDRIRGFEAGKDQFELDNLRTTMINQIVVKEDIALVAGKKMSVVTLEFKSGVDFRGSVKIEGFDIKDLTAGQSQTIKVNPFTGSIDTVATKALNDLLSNGSTTDLVF